MLSLHLLPSATDAILYACYLEDWSAYGVSTGYILLLHLLVILNLDSAVYITTIIQEQAA